MSLTDRFGSAKRPDLSVERVRPEGLADASVEALGKLSAALETAEHARGHLYAFHRMSGQADRELQESLDALRSAGHVDLAKEIDEVLVGRGVVGDRWTYELVEQYDDDYLVVFRVAEALARERTGAPKHLFEAEMQAREQRRGRPG